MPRIHYSSRQHTQNAELEFIKLPPNPSFFPLRLSLFSFDCQLTFFSFFILEKMTFTIPWTVASKLQTHRRPGIRFSFVSPCLGHVILLPEDELFRKVPTLSYMEVPSTQL